MRRRLHKESHLVSRIGWLRAAVLGANDGIISTASLILGVASAATSKSNVLISGIAGLVAGAMSMAAGEYVSVSSQSDTENADLARERRELANDPEFNLRRSTSRERSSLAVPDRLPSSSWRKMHWAHMPAMSSASPRSPLRVLCKRHWRRRQLFRLGRLSRSRSRWSRLRAG